jgi:hypothetical protein
MTVKLATFFDIILEIIIFCIELYFLNELSKTNLHKIGEYNEYDRRAKFTNKYSTVTSSCMVVFFVGLIVSQLGAQKQECLAN